MAVTLGSNISSLRAQTELSEATSSLTESYQQLSSGLRINSASDDAAGLAIASQLNSKSRVFTQAIRNVNDGLSVASVVEGALTALKDISQRQFELAEEAANGTYSTKQRQALNVEANKLTEEYNRIVGSTTFNGLQLFDASTGSLQLQAGYGTNGTLQLDSSGQASRSVADSFQNGISEFAQEYSVSAADFADFTNDGKADIITIQSDIGANPGEVDLFVGNGDGTFRSEVSVGVVAAAAANGGSPSASNADINGDGLSDIVFNDRLGYVHVLISNGNGTFKSDVSTAFNNQVSAKDINGDGKADLVSSNVVRLGNGDGTFKNAVTFSTIFGGDTHVGDFNGDGKVDILEAGDGTKIAFGNGDGTYSTLTTVAASGASSALAVGDINGDGYLDFAETIDSEVDVFLGNGNGTFAGSKSVGSTIPQQSYGITIADINGDGRVDIVAGGISSIQTIVGNGDGTFSSGSVYTGNQNTFKIELANVSGNGVSSIASIYYGGVDLFQSNSKRTVSVAYLNIASQQGARDALNTVQSNLDRIESQLGTIGATTSRFQTALSTLQTENENFLAAASRITDVDVASETATLTREQILQQAAVSVLAQANQQPALALKLLS